MSGRLALVTTDDPLLLEHEFDLEPLLAEFARPMVIEAELFEPSYFVGTGRGVWSERRTRW